jgi:hypothetical protein
MLVVRIKPSVLLVSDDRYRGVQGVQFLNLDEDPIYLSIPTVPRYSF